MTPRRHALLAAPAALAGAALLAACSSSGSTSSGASGTAGGGAKEVTIVVTDKGCDPATVEVPAGSVKLTAKNAGGDIAELEVLQGAKVVGEAENIAPDFTKSFTIDVAAGTYELICYSDKAPKGSLTAK
ncbi:MAG: cupredoxin domain-containing protein [Acidimicrobiales bacterium]